MKMAWMMGVAVLAVNASDCTTGGDTTPGEPVGAEEAAEVALNASWGNNVDVEVEGDTLIIESNGLPNHDFLSVYVAEGRDGSFFVEPVATEQRFEIPLVPTWSEEITVASAGSIGISVSGGLFFNPYEGDQSTYAMEDNYEIEGVPFIDACNGHPDQTAGNYHYHGTPYCITDVLDNAGTHSVLIGYLRDGYPVYGPQDHGGSQPSDLDACSGHTGATPEFPDGTYHYHTTGERPYIMECYHGVVSSAGGPGGPPPM